MIGNWLMVTSYELWETIEVLLKKETLLYSDIKSIRESVKITTVAA